MTETKENIVWLASYPKSGNTWFRVYLSNLLSNSNQPVNINELIESPISSNRNMIDSYLGINSSELTTDELNNLRPEVYRKISEIKEEIAFIKIHDAWTLNSKGLPLFPKEITMGVIYIIRNPLDIVVSYAFHNNETVDQTISALNNSDALLCANKNKLYLQTPQILASWSDHVISWINKSKLPVHVIRFEDMLNYPLKTFKRATEFLNLKYGESEIVNAIKKSSFNVLKDMEISSGFKEKSIHSNEFFRKGKSNEWKTELSRNQVAKIIDHQKEVMIKFGYLDNTTHN